MNPKVPGSPVKRLRDKTRLIIEPQLARISAEHGVDYRIKKVGRIMRIVVGVSNFPCLRVNLEQKKRGGTYLAVDGVKVEPPPPAPGTPKA